MSGPKPMDAATLEVITDQLQLAALEMRQLAKRKPEIEAQFDRLLLGLSAIRDEPSRRMIEAELDLRVADLRALDEQLAAAGQCALKATQPPAEDC